MSKVSSEAYKDIRGNLETGDIVLFSGQGGPVSATIKLFTSSKWSHVGMVYYMPEHDTVMLWESDFPNAQDVHNGGAKRGAQIGALSNRIRHYNGEISVRRLSKVKRSPKRMENLREFRREVNGRPYEENMMELVKAAYDGPFGENTEDLSSLFCSELVAEAYQRMGLLDDTKPSNEYTPADFSRVRKLVLKNGTLGKETTIKL